MRLADPAFMYTWFTIEINKLAKMMSCSLRDRFKFFFRQCVQLNELQILPSNNLKYLRNLCPSLLAVACGKVQSLF